jgi:rare lipoprotein A
MSSYISQAKALRILLSGTFLWLFTTVNAQESKEGYASFYHDKFNGRRTASGEKFNNNSYTCAHRTLPFGTKVEITNLKNGKFVVATVNDRGPYNYSRLIDVSKRVAKELDFHGNGTARVSIKVISSSEQVPYVVVNETVSNDNLFGVKLGTFDNSKAIVLLSRQMMDEFGMPLYVVKQKMVQGFTYKVYAGTFDEKSEAETLLNKVAVFFPDATVEAYSSFVAK